MVKESTNETKKKSLQRKVGLPLSRVPKVSHSPTYPTGKGFDQFFICPFRNRLYIHVGYILSNIAS